MNIELHELAALLRTPTVDTTGPWKIGQAYMIRTVTMTLTGRLTNVGVAELELTDAAWIADTGRFSNALATGELSEVEPMPGIVIVGRGSIVDACEWSHPLPRTVK